ncbi:helicase carboxy-terminal domain protein, partial [Rhizoctonia solani AG-3 Rhs1AP]
MSHDRMAYATLIARFEGNLSVDPLTPWDFFPFNSDTFCEIAGLESTKVGLSKPPVGRIGSRTPHDVCSKWEGMVKRAENFVAKVESQHELIYRIDDKKRFRLDSFYRDVICNTPGYEAWEWLVAQTFGRPGGLYETVMRLMNELGCDELAGYLAARNDLIYCRKDTFKESDVTLRDFSRFDTVWIPVRDSFGVAVFGNITGDYTSPPWTWSMLKWLCERSYQKGAQSLVKSIEQMKSLEEDLAEVLADAKKRPTKAKLTKAGELCGDIHRVHRSLGLSEQLLEESLARLALDELMDSLGRSRGKSGTMQRTTARHPKAHLVKAGDLDAAWIAYQHAIRDPLLTTIADVERGRDILEDEDAFTDGPLEGLNSFPTDLGVSAWKDLTEQGFKQGFGIPECGLPGSRLGEDGRPIMKHMEHQYAGIAEITKRCFTEAGGDLTALPTLLADAVGLGKTAQAIGVIQMIWHLKAIQDSNPDWPEEPSSIKDKWPAFLPMAHWRYELQTWLADDGYHVLQYRSGDLDYRRFSSKNSPYMRAKEACDHWERTLLLVESSGLCAEGRRLLTTPGNAAAAEPSSGHEADVAKSIFGQEFLLGLHMVMTASPVGTHPRGLLYLARLLRMPGFTGSAGVTITSQVERLFREGKQELDPEVEEQDTLGHFLGSFLSGTVLESPEPSEAELSQTLVQKLTKKQILDKSQYLLFWATRDGLYFLRHHLRQVIIRRDSRSKDSQGNSLLGPMAKVVEITSFLQLHEPTLAAAKMEAEQLKSIRGTTTLIDLTYNKISQGFFTRLKRILVHHRLAERSGTESKEEETNNQFFEDLEDYRADPSAKIDRVLRLCEHHLGPQNANTGPLNWNEKGEEVPGPQLNEEKVPEEDLRKRKMVIYCHLSHSCDLFEQVLKLHGIVAVQVNGTMGMNQRDRAVQSFNSEDGPDVMLLSNVGATGLNLQRGTIVVFVDHPWSDSDIRQIIVYLLRRGQKRQVIVYRLIARGTPDEYLIGYAAGNKLRLEVLIEVLKITGMSEEEILLQLQDKKIDRVLPAP